ncbi:Clc [Symbiodinium microadriaticum]|nr:Clc [Symbiodinium microadriaticum]
MADSEFVDMPEAEDEEVETTESYEPMGMPEPEVEDALSKFNREWNERLEEKKRKEDAAEEEAKATAAEELANYLAQRQTRMSAKKEVNRSEEQVLLEQLESDLDGANVWDRVSKLIEAGVDVPDDPDRADVSRMRKLFIHLKNEPLETTRGAAVEA